MEAKVMSKTYDRIKAFQEKKAPVYHKLKDNQGSVSIKNGADHGHMPVIIALFVFSALLLVLGASAFNTLKNLTSSEIITARKLSNIEELLAKNTLQLESFAKDFEQMKEEVKASSAKTQAAQERMAELEKKVDGQVFVINNLVKVKDQLVSRVAKLEQPTK
jgi:hypothetical protein